MDEARLECDDRIRVDGYWLILAYPNNPTIRFDARALDRLLANDDKIILAIATTTPFLRVPGGTRVASRIAQQLAPYTRSAPIWPGVYEDAKRRLDLANGKAEHTPVLHFGNDSVRASERVLYIGTFKCLILDVEQYAFAGADLPLPDGVMPAAVAMLAVAARNHREDPIGLARRIAEYESCDDNMG